MKIDAKQELAQKQMLSQAQVQSLNILAMTGDELEQFVQREVEDNPLLEQPDCTAASVLQTGGCRVSLSRASGEDEAAYRDIPAPEQISLRDHLRGQLDERVLNAAEMRCMCFLIDSLDGQGFLDASAQEVASVMHVDPALAVRCVERLRALDPPGVGARDLGIVWPCSLGAQAKAMQRLKRCCKAIWRIWRRDISKRLPRKPGFHG